MPDPTLADVMDKLGDVLDKLDDVLEKIGEVKDVVDLAAPRTVTRPGEVEPLP